MTDIITNNARFTFLQKQITRKLKARTLMHNSKISSQEFNHITNLKNDIPFPLNLSHEIRDINTPVDSEDFFDLSTTLYINRVIMYPENFETLIYSTFIPALEEEECPDIYLKDDLFMLV